MTDAQREYPSRAEVKAMVTGTNMRAKRLQLVDDMDPIAVRRRAQRQRAAGLPLASTPGFESESDGDKARRRHPSVGLDSPPI